MNEVIKKENTKIEDMIYEIRGKQVMLASDVAKLYNSETRIINQVVKRNINRFPSDFCFQLTISEWFNLRSQIVTSNEEKNKIMRGGTRYLPYVFTEHGIMMLSGLLKSDIAAEINKSIIKAFVKMKKYISNGLLEQKYINNQVMKNTEDIKLLQESLSKLQEKRQVNEIYFNGQIYDAYSKIIDILKEAKNEIVIIDAYSDKTVLDLIRNLDVKVTLIVKSKSLLTKTDIEKYNEQYNNLKVIYNDTFHDRYFILDKSKVYHSGTSLNRIGTKTFSINKIEDSLVINNLINNVYKLI